MDTEITPEQKAQLQTWAGQRDAALLEISGLRTEQAELQKANNEIANSYTKTETEMLAIRGRIEELKIKEAELPLLISREIASLQSEKSSLETEVRSLSELIEVLTEQKSSIEEDIGMSLAVLSTLKEESTSLEKIVDHVTKVSEHNITRIDAIVANLGKSLEEIIEVNKKNVFETNLVIDKVPKMLVELQKHGLVKNKI